MSSNFHKRWHNTEEQAKFLQNSECQLDKAYAEHLRGPNKDLPFSIMLVCRCPKCALRQGKM